MTPFNANVDKATLSKIKNGEQLSFEDVSQAKPYSNLCGLFALAKSNFETEDSLNKFHEAILRAQAKSAPAYD